MKNGLFNIIRGIAFCFVLSIIFIFGRVEAEASTLQDDFDKLPLIGNYVVCLEPNKTNFQITYIYTDNCRLVMSDNNQELFYKSTNGEKYSVEFFTCPIGSSDLKSIYGSPSSYVNSGTQFYPDSSQFMVASNVPITYQDGTPYTSFLCEIPKIPNELSYDSTLGYLDNCIRKCMNQVSFRDPNGGFHSIVDVITDKLLGINSSLNFEGLDGVDCYSWLDKTTSGKSFDSVEVYISLFKEGSFVKENSFILEGCPLYYDVSWKSLDSAISGLDLLTLKYNYQIWFRPLSANSYGDWVYFDCEYNRVSERIQSLVSHILDGDIINSIDDFKLTVENCQFGIVQGDYNKPSDVPPSSIVPNVLYNGVYTQIYKPTISDDDKDNILQQIPDSSPSYTEVINNITIIQNGDQSGDSLIDKFGDLLSFFKNFLTFIYNFINLILSPLSFLPGWLKSLLSMSIIAFIVICVIKTLRG